MNREDRDRIPPERALRMKEALGQWLAGESELRAIVLEAVDAGGSITEVAAITGLREETIEQWTGLTGDTAPDPRPERPPKSKQPALNSDGEVDQLAELRTIRGGGWQAVETAEAKSRRTNPEQD